MTRPAAAIRADLEHPHIAALLAVRASVGDGPIGRLLRDVEPLVDALAAVERERDEARADAKSHRQGADQWYGRAVSARSKLKAALARIAAVEAERSDAISAMRLMAESCEREDGPFPPDRDDPTYSLNRGSMLGQSAGWRNAAAMLEQWGRGMRPGAFHCDDPSPHPPHRHTINTVTGACTGRAVLAASPTPNPERQPGTRTPAELLREITARDPEAHKQALARGYGCGPTTEGAS